MRGDVRLAQVDLVEIHRLGLHAEQVAGIERVAPELERGVARAAAGLPVHQPEPSLRGPEPEVRRHPHLRALEVEHLRPVLDRPVLGRRAADLGQEREPEEVAQAGGDVLPQRLPRLGLEVDLVLVLEERRRLGDLAIAAVA